MPEPASETSEQTNFMSNLSTGAERFLSQVIVFALDNGWRTAKDFLRHFGPTDLMEGLQNAVELRTQILVEGARMNEKIARKKSTRSAAEDLQLALEEGITDADTVLGLIPPDDRVRYLDAQRLWAFVTEGDFWKATRDDDAETHARAVLRMSFTLENALSEGLITLQEVADGIGFKEISLRLPLEHLQQVVERALQASRNEVALSEEVLLDIVPLRTLVGFIPLDHVWREVVVERVAGPSGFIDGFTGTVRARPAAKAKKAPKPNGKLRPGAASPPSRRPSVPPPPVPAAKAEEIAPPPPARASTPPPARSSAPPPSPAELTEDWEPAPEPQARSEEPDARAELVQRLQLLERLPPGHAELSLPILASIEGMYAELWTLGSDEEREECIRDSFPNEGHLKTAMLALIELLDPSVNTTDPLMQEADTAALIKVVLFEERRRSGQSSAPERQSDRTVPPPLPRTP